MRLPDIFLPLVDLRIAVGFALVPTLKEICRRPLLLLHPYHLSQVFFSFLWDKLATPLDEHNKILKQSLITPGATGVVLEAGAGHGHTIPYFDRTKVTTYIAVEPNELFHPVLRATAAKYGYNEASGSFILIPLGAENSSDILKSLGDHHINNGVDTIICILTFCSIPSAETVITQFIGQLLRPGGILLFLEHVRSNRPDVRRWQTRWAPIWTLFFDGCRMDVPSDRLINDMDIWVEKEVWSRDDETDERLFWHRVGRYVRA